MTAGHIQPREYQQKTIARVRSSLAQHRATILQSPTGSGKSVMIGYMLEQSHKRGKRAYLTCHRRELVKQLSTTLWRDFRIPHGVIAAGRSITDDPIQVASIQTLVRRLDKIVPPDLLAMDEAHHATAATWSKVAEWAKDGYLVGLTATPVRTDGRGLNDLFNDIVLGPSVAWLIAEGYLSPFRVFAPSQHIDLSGVRSRGGDYARNDLEELLDRNAVVGNAVDHYVRLVHPGTCLVYCVSRAHAKHVEAAYQARGIDARYCAGDTPQEERDDIISGLREGRIPVVVSVDLFGEGLDCPGLNSVQLLRPTQSLGLHLQQVGRALRPEPGKQHAIILDHVHNTLRHGLPDDERTWTLEGRKKGQRRAEETGPALRHCSGCFAIYGSALPACPLCGLVPEVRVQMPEETDGELAEITREKLEAQRTRRRQEGQAQGLEALTKLALERGYKPGWAARRHAIRTKGDFRALIKQEREIRRTLA